jgi:glycosyltransferase involved in cell wall biosynthesis
VRILLINAFHYLKGGVERTYLDESRWLAAAGHEVGHFAIRDPRNLPSPTARHFAPAADYGEGGSPLAQIGQLPRALWSGPAARAMEGLLADFRPDVAHVHAPSRYLTPSFLRPLERARVPVVMTLHDFKHRWCTNRILFARGAPCERCKGGHHWHAATTGCVQGSRAKSAVAAFEAYLHDAIGAWRVVRLFVCPSDFVRAKAIEFGADPATLRVLHHGVEPQDGAADAGDAIPAEPYALFAGRLSLEKGVRLLPGIAAALGRRPLYVAGEGPLRGVLDAAAARTPSLRLLGHLPDATLAAWRRRAAAVLVPSLFYEHFGYTAAEALLDRRPVVAARIGALPELVEHEVTGQLAPPGDAGALAAALVRAFDDPAAARWAEAGAERVRTIGDPARHLEGLLAIYGEARG